MQELYQKTEKIKDSYIYRVSTTLQVLYWEHTCVVCTTTLCVWGLLLLLLLFYEYKEDFFKTYLRQLSSKAACDLN